MGGVRLSSACVLTKCRCYVLTDRLHLRRVWIILTRLVVILMTDVNYLNDNGVREKKKSILHILHW